MKSAPIVSLRFVLAVSRARSATPGANPWIGDPPPARPAPAPGPAVDFFALLGIPS